MPLFGTRGAASVTGFGGLAKLGYLLRNSLRFRASNSNYLSRTFGSATSTTTGTFSFWMKRGKLSNNYQYIWSASNYDLAYFDASDNLWIAYLSNLGYVNTNAVFRDPSAWYHVMIVFDTTNATAANRLQVYVNGVAQSLNWGSTPQTQNATFQRWNVSGYTGDIGDIQFNHTSYFDGYLAEYYWIDGQALTPSSFGKTDSATGQWLPIKYSGTYGTNGFYLPFTNTTSTSTLGNDFSGNSNTWTVNNFSLTAGATYDSMTDVPTVGPLASNYAVMNPLNTYSSITVNDANLKVALSEANYRKSVATMAFPTTGKYYVEANLTGIDYASYGIVTPEAPLSDRVGATATGYGATTGTAQWDKNNNGTSSGNFWTFTAPANPVLQIAVDTTSGKLWLGYNNIWLDGSGGVTGNPSAGTNETFTINTTRIYLPSFGGYKSDSIVFNVNFGQRAFVYTPPTGFKALNTYNLP